MEPVGIRVGYPRLPLRAKARAYLSASRPFTLLAPIVGTATALCMVVLYNDQTWHDVGLHWRTVVHGAATLLAIQIGSNFVNQATDPEDAVNKPYRPLPQGLVSRDELLTIGHVLWIVAILRATLINPSFGILCSLIAVTSYIYSHRPIRLKSRLWLGNIDVAIARGLLGLPAAWTILAPLQAPEPWIIAALLFIFNVGAVTCKDFADELGDKEHGIFTLVTTYGAHRAAYLTVPFILTPIFLIPVTEALGLARHPAAYLFTIYASLMLAYHLVAHPRKANRILEGTKPWAWAYFTMMGIMLTFALPAIHP